MSRYTIQLRTVIDLCGEDEVKSWFMDYELSDYLSPDEIAVITNRGVWKKEKLAQAIIDHYYMYEIGLETPGLFKHQAKVMMRELMEEKLPLIYSASLNYNPLLNTNIVEAFDKSTDSKTSSNSETKSNGSGLTVSSDTPQGQISKSAILNGNYASSTGANESENNVKDSSSANGEGNEHYVKTTSGTTGSSAAKMIQDFRKNIVMINRDIIKDVGTLFMSVY